MTGPPEVKKLLQEAECVIVFAGAGASVDFGLSTYWTGHGRKYASDKTAWGYTELEHSTYPFWEKDYEANHAYHAIRKAKIEEAGLAHPENFYSALQRFTSDNGKGIFLVTTNVDGYGRRFGMLDHEVLEVHGTVDYNQCFEEPQHGVFQQVRCEVCGGRARPNTLMFQDFVFNPARLAEQTSQFSDFLDKHENQKMLMLEVGVGDTVPTLKNMAKKLAWETKSAILQVNPEPSQLEDGSGAIYWPANTNDLTRLLFSF